MTGVLRLHVCRRGWAADDYFSADRDNSVQAARGSASAVVELGVVQNCRLRVSAHDAMQCGSRNERLGKRDFPELERDFQPDCLLCSGFPGVPCTENLGTTLLQ
jgi:hypothetical protein